MMGKWLWSCKPQHPHITSVRMHCLMWPYGKRVRHLFDGIGPHLEELELETGSTVILMNHHARGILCLHCLTIDNELNILCVNSSTLRREGRPCHSVLEKLLS
jgi:hypothetical protein